MSEQDQNRSEPATPFKLTKAREKGAVARGGDLGFLVSLAVLSGYFWVEGPSWRAQLSEAARRAIAGAPEVLAGPHEILAMTGSLFWFAGARLAWLAATLFAVVFVFELIQTGPVFTAEPLRPDFSRLNPANGFKRVFSLRQLIETAKNLLKMLVYGTIALLAVRQAQSAALPAITDAASLADAMAGAGFRLLAFFALAAIVFAILDQLIARSDFQRRMRMTRRDIRRELRDREGEPRLKQRRKQLHRQYVRLAKSMRNIRDADVLITNPVHYAVALKYDPATMIAPVIVSQAMNQYAQRLRRLAFIYGVVTVQEPALARSLYRRGVFEQPIPENHFREVAAIYISIREKERSSRDRVVA